MNVFMKIISFIKKQEEIVMCPTEECFRLCKECLQNNQKVAENAMCYEWQNFLTDVMCLSENFLNVFILLFWNFWKLWSEKFLFFSVLQ